MKVTHLEVPPRTPEVFAFWEEAKAACPDEPFTDGFALRSLTKNKPMSKQLVSLVIAGEKRGTASLPWAFEATPEDYPREGQYLILCTADGTPGVLVQLERVWAMPFNEVTEAQSELEGAPIRAIEKWRQVHWAYWKTLMRKADRGEPSEDMTVLCQKFRVVYVPPETEAAA